ncbi:hypothetical protein [Paenibacillus senegalensis]|uniref:hypothetical protein n=1 Tax=Paenibacillus senegalensis TaxID=1465766 RepID=UPI000289B255|nr:hypothetical protein [Paenibacillus senegalensis]
MRNPKFTTIPSLFLCCILLIWLTACGTVSTPFQEGIVFEEDQVTLSSDPDPPIAEQQTQLKVELEASAAQDIRIDFEVRKEGSARGKFLKTSKLSDHVYTADETFQDSGTYRVFIHIYSSDIHQTMEKKMEIH